MIAVGGGGGGTNGHQSGGAGGSVKCAKLQVPSLTVVPVIIGGGGRGAKELDNNDIVDCLRGEPSSFGTYLVAPGGGGCNSLKGNAGGTGSGAPCWAHSGGKCTQSGSKGGAGGSGGAGGGSASDGNKGGDGQGAEYAECLKTAKFDELTPGAGGEAVEANCGLWTNECWAAGGGGGGVFVNGKGPFASGGVYLCVSSNFQCN